MPSGSIANRLKGKKKYEVAYDVVQLTQVAKNTRPLDERYLADSNDIHEDFLDDVTLLVGKLPKTAHLSDRFI